jgi:UDP-N-acetylglucosamine acyltransferase
MPAIHPTAIVDSKAELAADVEVGPYAVIGPDCEVDSGCVIESFAQILGITKLGRNNRVFSHAVLGNPPQDKKYGGEPTQLVIGDGNVFRECVTVNTGTVQDSGSTDIGHNNWIMAYVHIAHDCKIGSNVIMANSVQLAGHVVVGDWAVIGGITGVHQFVRIGAHAMTGAGTTLLQDLPPYVMVAGNPARPYGINSEGLKRRGFSEAVLLELKRAYKLVYTSGKPLSDAIAEITTSSVTKEEPVRVALDPLLEFLALPGRGIVR